MLKVLFVWVWYEVRFTFLVLKSVYVLFANNMSNFHCDLFIFEAVLSGHGTLDDLQMIPMMFLF
jgi:hypothetical protein